MTRRTTIQIDERLLERAQAALGTGGLKDTVDAALEEVIGRSLRDRLADRVASGDGVDRSGKLLVRSRPSR